MRAIVVGGGKVGSHLAHLLMKDGYEVKVIECRKSVLAKLYRELPTETIMDGDGTRVEVLEHAGVRNVDVLVAVTGEDETNLVVALLGRRIFNVPRIIGRVNNPKNAWLFTRENGVDVALNQSDLLAKMIAEQMVLGDMLTLVRLKQGELALVAEKLESRAAADGQTVCSLGLPPECLLVTVIRGEEVLIPRGDTLLQAGDEIIALVRNGQKRILHQLLTQRA